MDLDTAQLSQRSESARRNWCTFVIAIKRTAERSFCFGMIYLPSKKQLSAPLFEPAGRAP